MILDEKYFRRIKPFEGNNKLSLRTWLFDFLVVIGQLDDQLATELKNLCRRAGSLDEKWDPAADTQLDQLVYERYKGELYGLLCGLTEGDAKSVVRTVVDKGYSQDGFEACVELGRRFESRTAANLLQAFTEAVCPPQVKGSAEIIPGIHKWEAQLAVLKSRYGEEINGNLRMAIFLGMLPKEYQDLIMQQSVMLKDVSYEHWRDHIINVVNQKQQMRKPTDMELGNVDAFGWYGSGFDAVSYTHLTLPTKA